MTFDQAQEKLEKLAVSGSQDLIPVSRALPLLKSQQIYRLIHRRLLPAVKVGGFKTTQAIAAEFFRLAIRPATKGKPVFELEPDRLARIEDAKRRVMGGAR